MFKNNLNPPPKVLLKCSRPNAKMITMTTDDTTMNVIRWIHDFPSQKPFKRLLKS